MGLLAVSDSGRQKETLYTVGLAETGDQTEIARKETSKIWLTRFLNQETKRRLFKPWAYLKQETKRRLQEQELADPVSEPDCLNHG